MTASRRSLILALGACGLAPTARAQVSKDASAVLTRARAASGGRAWNQLMGWRERGMRDGLRYEALVDPLRYGFRCETEEPGGGKALRGFNGLGSWRVAADGRASSAADAEALARARTEAFFEGWLFYFPSRFDARGAHLGTRSFGGRSYQVVRVQPWGGYPRELWFDARTGLLGRMVDRNGGRAAAVRVSDYRRVGGLLVAHRWEPEGGGAGKQIESLSFAAADRALFSLPPPPPPKVEAPKPPPKVETPPPPRKKRWWQR